MNAAPSSLADHPPVASTTSFPHIDASKGSEISDAEAEFFREQGLLVIRNVLRGTELAEMQRETQLLVDRARAGTDHEDFQYREHEISGERVPFRVEYVIDKTLAGLALLADAYILRTVAKFQGRNFIPTWDSLVFKNPGAGVAIPWHRDAGTHAVHPTLGLRHPIFNVDFYLDQADIDNCLWGILGSNRWDQATADRVVHELNQGGFQHGHGAQPILMQPGDVILHNILALHGSPPTSGRLRRVVYYEFRPGETEREMGPHIDAYRPLKQQQLTRCIELRRQAAYAQGETPYAYAPDGAFALPGGPQSGAELPTFRHPHHHFWRTT